MSSGCGCKEVYRFPHITYPYSSCICSFLQQHPCSFFKIIILYTIYNCEINIKIFQLLHTSTMEDLPFLDTMYGPR